MKRRILYISVGTLAGLVIIVILGSIAFGWLEHQRVEECSEGETAIEQQYRGRYPKAFISFNGDAEATNKLNAIAYGHGVYRVNIESNIAFYDLEALGSDSLGKISEKIRSELDGKLLNEASYDSLRVHFLTFRIDSTYSTINKTFEARKVGIFNEQYRFCIRTK